MDRVEIDPRGVVVELVPAGQRSFHSARPIAPSLASDAPTSILDRAAPILASPTLNGWGVVPPPSPSTVPAKRARVSDAFVPISELLVPISQLLVHTCPWRPLGLAILAA